MPSPQIGTFDSELVADFWQAVSSQGRMNLHVILHYGRNTHHVSEAIFKATARTALGSLHSSSIREAPGFHRPRERSEPTRCDRARLPTGLCFAPSSRTRGYSHGKSDEDIRGSA